MEVNVSITKKRATEIIAQSLLEFRSLKEFKLVKSWNSFREKSPFGFNSIGFGITNRWPLRQDVLISFGVRHDEVEKINYLFLNNVFGNFKSSHKHWRTIHMVPKFKNSREDWINNSVPIVTESELENLCNEIKSLIENQAFPFFEKYKNMHVLKDYKKELFIKDFVNGSKFWDAHTCVPLLTLLKKCKDDEYEHYANLISENYKLDTHPYNRDNQGDRVKTVMDCITYLNEKM